MAETSMMQGRLLHFPPPITNDKRLLDISVLAMHAVREKSIDFIAVAASAAPA
jgi:hypothetical protein